MRDLLFIFVHIIATLARVMGPGGVRSVVAESLLPKQQLLILNRSRQRAPNLRSSDRFFAGLSAPFMHPARLIRSAIVLKPSTLLNLHRTLRKRKYRMIFSANRGGKSGPKGPSRELIHAIVEMKQRNPSWGCPRIAQQLALAFGVPINKDIVRRLLAKHYRPGPDSCGPCRSAYDVFLWQEMGIRGIPTPYSAPNAAAHIERLIGTLRRECLDRILIWNEAHPRCVLKEFIGWCNHGRVHRGLRGIPDPDPALSEPGPMTGRFVAIPVSNGLHHDYRLVA